MTRILADEWPKALHGVLVGAIIFLTLLPSLGWAWHRVLPEHMHLYLDLAQARQDDAAHDDPTGAYAVPLVDPDACAPCTQTQLRSATVHIPSFDGMAIVGIAAAVGLQFAIGFAPALSTRVVMPRVSYRSLVLPLLDPPPKVA